MPLTTKQKNHLKFLAEHGPGLTRLMQGGPIFTAVGNFLAGVLQEETLALFPGQAEKQKTLHARIKTAQGDRLKKDGPKLWAQIHTRALKYQAGDVTAAAEKTWLQSVAGMIPCGECRRDYEAYLAAHPPALASADSYFVWTVELHNTVNAKPALNYPILDMTTAREWWSKAVV